MMRFDEIDFMNNAHQISKKFHRFCQCILKICTPENIPVGVVFSCVWHKCWK